MKSFFYSVLLFSLPLFAQEYNKVVVDSSSEKPMLVGYTTREAFQDTSFSWWFNSEYEMYEPDTVTIDKYKDLLNETYITIVMGTWCSDSRREVPRFLKILDYAKYPEKSLKIINVDRQKQAENTYVSELNIELVPTIIINQCEKELGRIVESPKETLEKDLEKILQ